MLHTTPSRRGFLAAVAIATTAAVTMTLTPAQAVTTATPQAAPTPHPQEAQPLAPVLAPLAQDAQNALAYAFAMVAADPAAAYRDGTVEADLAKGFATLPVEQRQNFANYGAKLVTAPEADRVAQFGQYGKLTVDQFRGLGFDGVFTSASATGDRAAVRDHIVAEAHRLEVEYARDLDFAVKTGKELGYDLPVLELPRIKTLTYYVERVRCDDDTNPEWAGDDEISMGGIKIDHLGNTTKIDPFEVAGDFDDNEVKDYGNPGLPFAQFDLTAAGQWARTYVVTGFLAEVDNGGFADALNSAWGKVKAKVQAVVAEWVTGVTSGWLGEAIAGALGQVVGWLVGAFVNWVINLFHDDLFAPVTASVTLPTSIAFMYYGWSGWSGSRLPSIAMGYSGHGGQYTATGHWQVSS